MSQVAAESDPIAFYGFTPVPRDPDVLFKDHPTASGPSPKQDHFTVAEFSPPDSAVVRAVDGFVKKELLPQTYNHSRRVFIYGLAIARTHFPDWRFDPETYYLSCLLHDIGTADRFLGTTKMSFEFKGAIVAREFIREHDGAEDQADSVCEAIVRHQDIFVTGGNITMVGQLLQLATILDNVGKRADLLHRDLIVSAVEAFPRNGWSECFASTIHNELNLKPWCHTTTFEKPNWKQGDSSNFANDVLGNKVMQPYN
ncbi:cyanamide hydratase [Peniophora sp. CONT]|nr:cyanamide hydratase [Peniophora sp. CONT]